MSNIKEIGNNVSNRYIDGKKLIYTPNEVFNSNVPEIKPGNVVSVDKKLYVVMTYKIAYNIANVVELILDYSASIENILPHNIVYSGNIYKIGNLVSLKITQSTTVIDEVIDESRLDLIRSIITSRLGESSPNTVSIKDITFNDPVLQDAMQHIRIVESYINKIYGITKVLNNVDVASSYDFMSKQDKNELNDTFKDCLTSQKLKAIDALSSLIHNEIKYEEPKQYINEEVQDVQEIKVKETVVKNNPSTTKRTSKISKSKKELIVSMYRDDGISVSKIAKQLHIKESRISSIIHESGVFRKSQSNNVENLNSEELLELYKSGLTFKEIAAGYDVSQSAIRSRILKAANVKDAKEIIRQV